MTNNQATKKPTTNNQTADSVIIDNTVLELTIPWKTAERAYNQALTTLAKKVKVEGFRQGKVPLKIAETKIGRLELIDRALNQVVPAAYEKLIQKEGKKPLTQPEIKPLKLEWEQDWVLEVQIAEEPEVKLGDYKKAVKAGKKAHDTEHKTEAKKDTKKKADKAAPADDHDHHHEDDHILQHILKELVDTVKPRIPELLLKEQTRAELQRLVRSIEPMKMTLENYLERRKMNFEQLSQELATVSLGQLQVEYILKAIVATEKLDATDAEIEAKKAEYLKEGSKPEAFEGDYAKNYLKSIVTRDKVIKHLLSI